ncbi:hypothetical protein HY523_00585 [Candidatus Berkelbacteria bacterium]|nr:hypothetical protein [Candidatus Berkelbacteria bacterium]
MASNDRQEPQELKEPSTGPELMQALSASLGQRISHPVELIDRDRFVIFDGYDATTGRSRQVVANVTAYQISQTVNRGLVLMLFVSAPYFGFWPLIGLDYEAASRSWVATVRIGDEFQAIHGNLTLTHREVM